VTPLRRAYGDVRRVVQKGERQRFAEADEALHVAVVELAGVPALGEVWYTTWHALRAFHDASLREYWPDLRSLQEEHEYLVEAVCSGDPGVAEDAARNHLEAVRYRMAEQEELAQAYPDPVQRVKAYLAFHLHRPLRLTDVARDVAFISPGHLSRLLRERYGVGFQQYVQRERLERAARLLRTSRLPVKRVARRVGYADLSRFAQHFRRRFRITPRRYRDRQ
jgi:AraC-like DNA-binding protein